MAVESVWHKTADIFRETIETPEERRTKNDEAPRHARVSRIS